MVHSGNPNPYAPPDAIPALKNREHKRTPLAAVLIGIAIAHTTIWVVGPIFGYLHGIAIGDYWPKGLKGAELGISLAIYAYYQIWPIAIVSGFGALVGLGINFLVRQSLPWFIVFALSIDSFAFVGILYAPFLLAT